MIQDKETNIVYLSENLSKWKDYKDFSENLEDLLKKLEISYEWISDTKDIWARDYMPIQLEENDFLKYKYEPDYLRKSKSKTDCTEACSKIGIKYRETDLIIDGGNVVLCGDKVVMTGKVFTENNKEKGDKSFLKELKDLFKHEVIIIPWHATGKPDDKDADFYGHSDGFIKYCGDNRILMSNHRDYDEDEAIQIRQELEKNHFEVTEMLFNVDYPQYDLNWAYINFLQVGNNIIIPKFGIAEDEQAKRYVQNAFPYCRLRQIDCRAIAKKGGALHCVSWNIKK
ncbi:MAG: peptidylarginine deiminase-like enzyme [Bacteroidetes bacterium]|nr:peptidylarginine deiminase-like enzyme [Bacteroidota bacterium]